MNTLLNSERDEDIEDTARRRTYGKDREITLGTTLILGIFFALAVFGAVFFGFGYSMGVKHLTSTSPAVAEGGSSTPFNSFKPAPGSPLGSSAGGPLNGPAKPPAGAMVAVPLAANEGTSATTAFVPRPQAGTRPSLDAFSSTDVPPAAVPAPAAKLPVAAIASAPSASASGTGQTMVQVAAVSHQEDADLLVSTLKRHGYNVGIRSEAQDRLMHVQIGPFATRKDADLIRQKLLADGFNAILK